MKGISFTSKKGNNYFYDDFTGLIHFVGNNKLGDVVNKYKKLTKDVRVRKRRNNVYADTNILKEYLYNSANGFKQLLIEITSQCNLRCKYCIYSDHYQYTKTYSNNFMEFKTAKKAIDYYFDNLKKVHYRNPMRVPVIGFYGGEPLLNFKVIEEIVEYVNMNYNFLYGEIQYNITTNGLLLKDNIVDFLVKNNFAIIISLDGNKENHDRNRVKIDGTGSFDEIFENIKNFKKKYLNYPKLGISACYDIKSDLIKYMEFFDKEKLFVAKLSQIDPNNTTYYEQFTVEERKKFIRSHRKLQEKFFDQVRRGCIPKDTFLYTVVGISYSEFAIHPILYETRPNFLPFTSSCIPGEKIYVTTDGNFHICEKVNSNYSIGTIKEGLDWNKIVNIVNKYKISISNECFNCNVTRFCSLCFQHCCTDKGFVKPKNFCLNIETHVKNKLEDYIDILEIKPDLFDHITIDYYNTIYEMAGIILE